MGRKVNPAQAAIAMNKKPPTKCPQDFFEVGIFGPIAI